MSKEVVKRPDSPMNLALSANIQANKENFDPGRKRGGGRLVIPLPKNIKIPDYIRQKYEPKGAIPKKFGLSESATESVYFPPKGPKFPQSNFSVFDEDDEPLTPQAESTSIEEDTTNADGNEKAKHSTSDDLNVATIEPLSAPEDLPRNDAFQRAKDFFTKQEEAARLLKHDQRKKTFEHESNRITALLRRAASDAEPPGVRPRPLRIQQLITQHGENREITPHDVLAPQPKKVKLLHQLAEYEGRPVIAMKGVVSDRSFEIDDVAEYLKFQEQKANRRVFEPNYRLKNATVHQRQTVVHYIIRLGTHNDLPSHLIYQAVRMFDDMLQVQPLTVRDLQLMMLASLWITMKRDYIAYRIPPASKVAAYSDGQYTEKEVCDCEKRILVALQFNFNYPDPFSLLCYCILSRRTTEVISDKEMDLIYYSGGYMIDLCLLNEELIIASPILIGSAAAELAMALILPFEDRVYTARFEQWRCEYAKQRLSAEEIGRVRTLLIRDIIESCYVSSKAHIIYKKYNRSRYGRITRTLTARVQKLLPPS